jgi:YfiH family protein
MSFPIMGTNGKGQFRELPRSDGGARTVLSLKAAGNMSLSHGNRRRAFLESLGIESSRAVYLKQVHSQIVFTVGAGGSGNGDLPWPLHGTNPPEGDGMITAEKKAVLCVTVADCLPIVLHDRGSGAFGLLHSGWKGTGIVTEALHRMQDDYGSKTADISAVLGPCIGSCCYNVPVERYRLFLHRYGEAAGEQRNGGYFIDLQQANIRLLSDHGVGDLKTAAECTSCTDDLSSFRRDGPAEFSLMMAVCGYF